MWYDLLVANQALPIALGDLDRSLEATEAHPTCGCQDTMADCGSQKIELCHPRCGLGPASGHTMNGGTLDTTQTYVSPHATLKLCLHLLCALAGVSQPL